MSFLYVEAEWVCHFILFPQYVPHDSYLCVFNCYICALVIFVIYEFYCPLYLFINYVDLEAEIRALQLDSAGNF